LQAALFSSLFISSRGGVTAARPNEVKKIFLTGASSGIGLATANALLKAGHQVWGTSRQLDRLPSITGLHPVRLDLNDRASIEDAWNSALQQAGFFDVVINNAGSGHFNPAALLSPRVIQDQFQLLVFGQIQLCQAALQSMEARQRGLIINVTSLAASLPVPFTAAYNAAKAAMVSFTMTMQLELGDSPIRIVDVQPGDISTDFNDAVVRDDTRDGHYQERMDRAWGVVSRNMQQAPKAEVVAERIVRLVDATNPPPRVRVGDTFQSAIAPMISSILPPRLRVLGLRRYYRI
jgi:NAD(P)-dependent dehydrogenase (short-subunit alcohol dehydrogenase family)